MNSIQRVMAGIGVFASLAMGTTITLQQGQSGYSGCQDVSLFSDAKAESYSWYNNGQSTGTPTDPNLIFTRFTC